MSGATKRTLLAIAVFVAIMLGSFIWFVVTWDKSREAPVSQILPPVQTDRQRGLA